MGPGHLVGFSVARAPREKERRGDATRQASRRVTVSCGKGPRTRREPAREGRSWPGSSQTQQCEERAEEQQARSGSLKSGRSGRSPTASVETEKGTASARTLTDSNDCVFVKLQKTLETAHRNGRVCCGCPATGAAAQTSQMHAQRSPGHQRPTRHPATLINVRRTGRGRSSGAGSYCPFPHGQAPGLSSRAQTARRLPGGQGASEHCRHDSCLLGGGPCPPRGTGWPGSAGWLVTAWGVQTCVPPGRLSGNGRERVPTRETDAGSGGGGHGSGWRTSL